VNNQVNQTASQDINSTKEITFGLGLSSVVVSRIKVMDVYYEILGSEERDS